jgi:arsenical pump membrane protein
VDTLQRIGPILGFLAAITALAHLSDRAGLFDVLARVAARRTGRSTWRLFLVVCALATITTITLSLDTTAVLLTPVVLALAQAVDIDARPLAYVTIWLANAGSLLLPISNLTNLLAYDRVSQLGTVGFAARMALPELAAVSVVIAVAAFLFRATLRKPHTEPSPFRAPDRVLFWVAAICCLTVAPASLIGLAPWKIATPAAIVLAVATLLRGGRVQLASAVPWRVVILVTGLFLAVATLGEHGLDAALGHVTGHGPFVTQLTGAGAGNVVNNLPSYVTLERTIPPDHTREVLALLLGTNAGTMLLVFGSLATVLWRERCRAKGLHIGAWEFLRYGFLIVPLLMLSTFGALISGPA